MKILMICGVYADENEQEVINSSKGYVEQSANIFQRKIIRGIDANNIDYKIISAPLIGAYPMRSKRMIFRGFSTPQNKYEYVPFNNIWGIRNFSRSVLLKKAIKKYMASEPEEEFLIIVYCPHTPFLSAASYAKTLRPKSKISMIVPDLPQYMNLNETGRGIYDILKKYDIYHMEKYIKQVDSFVLLTEPMKEVLRVGDRPYMVVEGLVDESECNQTKCKENDGIKRIVYTGKMNIRFGIKMLVDSFMKIEGDSYRLILCGDGDARAYIEEKSKIDSRIEYKGMVTAAQAKEYINSADVLVNPRPNDGEYTKYSFPSKNIEYLMSGKPVVAYMLDGMPKVYADFLYVIPPEMCSFEAVLLDACNKINIKSDFRQYAKEVLSVDVLVRCIMKLGDKSS